MMNDYDAKDDDDDDGDDASLHLPPLKLLLLLIETPPPPHPLPLLNLLSLKRLLLLSQMLFPSPPSPTAMFASLSFPTFLGLLSPFSLASSSFFSPPRHHLSFLLSCILVKIVKTLNVVVAFPHTVSRSQMIFFGWHLFAILKAINVLLTRFSAIDWFKRKQPADCKKFPNRQFVHRNHSQVNKYAMLFNVDHFIIVMTQVPLWSVSSEIIQKRGSPLHPRDWTSRETRKVGNFYLAAAVVRFWLLAHTHKQQINQPGENLLHRIMDLQSVK